MKVKIGRYEENITLNPKEYVLDDKGNIKEFETIKEAKKFLRDKGLNDFRGIDFDGVEE